MNRQKLLALVAIALSSIIFLSFILFDRYVDTIGNELIDATLHSEYNAFQQGNILAAVAKLQSAVNSSENLRGIGVFDDHSDPDLQMPLLKIGDLPAKIHLAQIKNGSIRTGLFGRLLVRTTPTDRKLVFYVNPRSLTWIFLALSCLLAVIAGLLTYLGSKIESIRTLERARVFQIVAKQISHDIKSPLSTIKLISGLMGKENEKGQLLISSTDRIEGILEDLNAQSEDFQAIFESKVKFDMVNAIDEIIDQKRFEFPNFPIQFQNSSAAVTLLGNPTQFKRVISNLITNAIEASQPSAVIDIQVSDLQKFTQIKIKDHGQGILPDALPKIFDRGFSNGKLHGSGLGLWHAKQAVESMGGKILVDSEVNSGSEFTIQFHK